MVDVFGPLEVLQNLAFETHLELALLARTLEPVTTEPSYAGMNKHNSSFWPRVLPTHTFADSPALDVLVVPGGLAARSPDLDPELAYIRDVFPSLQYLITICTGAGIAAKAGVLDGYRATTNKAAWEETTAMGPNVKWYVFSPLPTLTLSPSLPPCPRSRRYSAGGKLTMCVSGSRPPAGSRTVKSGAHQA